MSPRGYLQNPWIGLDSEVTVYTLRKVRNHLNDGGKLYIRTIMSDVTRYSVVLQGPFEHEKQPLLALSFLWKWIYLPFYLVNWVWILLQLRFKIIRGFSLVGLVHSAMFSQLFWGPSSLSLMQLCHPPPGWVLLFLLQCFVPPVVLPRSEVTSLPSSSISPRDASRDVGFFNWTNAVSAPFYWLWNVIDLRFWNYEWSLFFYDARHTPVILALGKLWSWSRTCPFVHIPLGLVAGLWLIIVLNITCESVWISTSTVISEVGCWVFRILDEFFWRSQVFRVLFFVISLYLFP